MQTIEELGPFLEVANADIAAGHPEKAVGPWMKIDWESAAKAIGARIVCNIGIGYSFRFLTETDPQKVEAFFYLAMSPLQAICGPEYKLPQVSLQMGVVAEHFADALMTAVNNPKCWERAGMFYGKAGEYYENAANMPDDANGGYPGTAARNLLSLFKKQPSAVEGKTEIFLKDFVVAATTAHWKAKLAVGFAYFFGEGANISFPNAQHWLKKGITLAPEEPENSQFIASAKHLISEIERNLKSENGSHMEGPVRPDTADAVQSTMDQQAVKPVL